MDALDSTGIETNAAFVLIASPLAELRADITASSDSMRTFVFVSNKLKRTLAFVSSRPCLRASNQSQVGNVKNRASMPSFVYFAPG